MLLMTSAVSKLFNPLNTIQHKSANQVLSQAHLMQLIKGFIHQGLELEHMKYLNWIGLLSVTFDCML